MEVEIAGTILDVDPQVERDHTGLHFSSGVQFRSGKKYVQDCYIKGAYDATQYLVLNLDSGDWQK